ncbi:MAG: TatD family hydrolase [Draconibacterium sp.]
MHPIPFIDVHTHSERTETDTVTVRNIFPGEGFAAFSGRNFYSVGLHPWHLKTEEENNELLNIVEDALQFDHVCFVGECGLDKVTLSDFEEQKRVFRAQAFMAEEFRKPLVVHCVKAYNEILEFHKKLHPEMPWIMHGYNGSVQLTEQLGERGVLFSFGENLFRENSKAVQSFKNLPLEKIFFETDEYFGDVEDMYKKGAELKGISIEAMAEAIWNNFSRVERFLLSRF